jgi:hypothetical protein
MKTISIAFVAALSLAAPGCKKGADCDKALDHSMELSKAKMEKTPGGMDDKLVHKLQEIGVQHCKDDKWPADVTSCMIDAKTEADSGACYAKLSPEQQKKMNEAAMKEMTAAMPPPPPPPSPSTGTPPAEGSAMAGSAMPESATGSAAAGSAMGSAAK